MGAKRNIPLAGDASRRMAEADYQAAKQREYNERFGAPLAEAKYQAAKQREYNERFGTRL